MEKRGREREREMNDSCATRTHSNWKDFYQEEEEEVTMADIIKIHSLQDAI